MVCRITHNERQSCNRSMPKLWTHNLHDRVPNICILLQMLFSYASGCLAWNTHWLAGGKSMSYKLYHRVKLVRQGTWTWKACEGIECWYCKKLKEASKWNFLTLICRYHTPAGRGSVSPAPQYHPTPLSMDATYSRDACVVDGTKLSPVAWGENPVTFNKYRWEPLDTYMPQLSLGSQQDSYHSRGWDSLDMARPGLCYNTQDIA